MKSWRKEMVEKLTEIEEAGLRPGEEVPDEVRQVLRENIALDRLDRVTVMLEALLKIQTVAVSVSASQAGVDPEVLGAMIGEVEAQFALASAKPQGAS